MATVYPRKYPVTGGGGLNEHDHNAIVDHINGILSEGVFEYNYDYKIRENGGYYEAININGQLVYGGSDDAGDVDGTDASAVTQAACDALPDTLPYRGGVIALDVYSIDLEDVAPQSYTTFIGSSDRSGYSLGTIINSVGDLSTCFSIVGTVASPVVNVTFRNIRLNGDFYNSNAVYAEYAHLLSFINCTIAGFASNAIYAAGCWEWQIRDSYFSSNGDLADPEDSACIYLTQGADEGTTNCNGWLITENIFSANKATCIYGANESSMPSTAFYYHNDFWVTHNWFHGNLSAATRPDAYYAVTGNFGVLHFSDNSCVFSNYGFLKIGVTSWNIMINNNNFSNATSYMVYFDTAAAETGNNPRGGMHMFNGNTIRYRETLETTVPSDGIVYFDSKGFIGDNNQVYVNTPTATVVPLVKKGSNASSVQVHRYQFNRGTDAAETYYSENKGITYGISPVTVTHKLVETPTSIRLTPLSAAISAQVLSRGTDTFTLAYSGATLTYVEWEASSDPNLILPGSLPVPVLALSLDEDSGSSVADLSGNGNDGTCTGTTVTTGVSDDCRVFNGSSDKIVVAHDASLNLEEITIRMWLYPTALTASTYYDLLFKGASSTHNYRIRLFGPQVDVDYTDTGATRHLWRSSSTPLTINTWQHLVVKLKASYVKVYVDGVLATGSWIVGTGAGTPASNSDDLNIGTSINGWYAGRIDQLEVLDGVET